jgi:serine/threonine protein kinase
MPCATSDRNLLFGILAVQMDFISRDALIKAMHAWVLEKSQTLGAILIAHGSLSRERHELLEALVVEHLKQHNNDPQQSLAAVSSIGSVKKDLEQIGDADVQASIVSLKPSEPERKPGDDPYATVAAGASTWAGLRFRILRPHARGGLGEVFVAHDEELHREVALKEIQNRHADNPDSRSRFLREAEITGGLEHPGIVPVYGLGQYADGRPFYAMRFIKGDSLQDAIEKYHKGEPGGSATGDRLLEFRKLLGRFIDVCQAMQYAHDRGVLHRDLKPGNIMLGKYGETLVVDWGLAKPGVRGAGSGGREAESQARESEAPLMPASASGSAETVAGTAVGTPAYMSPEQAAGRLDLLGPASDVYSLGATLYTLLTGKPSVVEKDGAIVLKKVQRGDAAFAEPGASATGLPGPLVAVCRKAMALQPADRYATPLALAGDLEHWLADEPVSAAPEPAIVRARRWMRKHPGRVSGIAAAVVVGVVSLGAATLALGAKNAELENANSTIGIKNEELKKSVALETAAREDAQKNEKLAAEQRTLALQTVRLVVDDIDAQLKNKPALQELRQKLLDKALEGLNKVARSADNSRAIDHQTFRVHLELGDLFMTLEGAGIEQAQQQYPPGGTRLPCSGPTPIPRTARRSATWRFPSRSWAT